MRAAKGLIRINNLVSTSVKKIRIFGIKVLCILTIDINFKTYYRL
jgi:hypothetical protein